MRKFWLFHPTFSLFSVLYYWHQCVWKLFHNTRLDLFPYQLAPKNYFTKVFILVELCTLKMQVFSLHLENFRLIICVFQMNWDFFQS